MTMFRCKKFPDTHKSFSVSAVEHHTWLVDEDGQFDEDMDAHDCEADLSYADCHDCHEPAEKVKEV